jgi:hypothetical protein
MTPNIYNQPRQPLEKWLIAISVIAIIVMMIMLQGCKTIYIPVGTTDSTVIHHRDSIIFDTVNVDIPNEEKSEIVLQTDTSILQTSLAISEAYITEDGRLFHFLRNKNEKKLKVPVHYVTSAITNNRIRIEPRVVEVEKKLNRWQELKMQVGGWAMVAIAALIIFYAIKICRRFKII